MRKVFLALATALSVGIGAYFSPEKAWALLVGIAIIHAAVVISWAVTSLFKRGHTAAAQWSGFVAAMVLGFAAWGWGAHLVIWMMFAIIPAALAPKLYEKLFRTDNAARAVLTVVAAKLGVRLRWGADGDLADVKVGEDPTIFVGSPTIPDMKREGADKPE